MDFPGFIVAPAPLDNTGAEVDREVARHIGKLQEKVLHHLSFLTERHHELFEAVGGVELHDVPENRMLADLYHRLGNSDCSFGVTGAKASGEDPEPYAGPRNLNRLPSTFNSWSKNESFC